MKYQLVAILAFSTVAIVGSAQADVENSRIQSLERDVRENTQNIANNAAAISANAAGIAANAAGVQANAAAIASIPVPTTYDYRDFNTDTSITSKTYALSGPGFCGNQEVRELSFAPTAGDPDSTDLTLTRKRLSGGSVCQLQDFIYRSTPTGRYLVAGHDYAPFGPLAATKLPDSPILTATTSMAEGSTVADGTLVTLTVEPDFGGFTETSVLVQSSVTAGLQDVTVPAGSFTGCLKSVVSRNSNTFGEFQRTTWRCPGVGEVKRIQINTNPSGSGQARRRHQTWELTNIEYAP